MKKRSNILFVALAVITVALFVVDLIVGSVAVPLGEVWRALFGAEGESEVYTTIVRNFRLPKAIMALLAGAALSSVGLQMQTLFRNPLAGPYVLGVSSGASLGVALMLLGLPLLGISGGASVVQDLGVAGAAWIGAAGVMVIVMAVTARIKNIMTVLILGMMFGSAASALVEVMQYLSPEGALKSYVVWTMGSLGGVTLQQLNIIVPVVVAGLLLSIWLIKPLNILLLGENYARTMGLNIKRIRFGVTLTTVLLAGTITAYCGPIGFIGLAVPHVARMLFREADHKILVPATMLTGAAMMLLCDVASTLPAGDMTLPINTVSALVGIPIVIIVIVRNRKTMM
ncbi:MAG: iron ABC transporter permease [Tidjanibacter sp.]|nr:iron ABC transporter permease [Tidjanibacter sp.]